MKTYTVITGASAGIGKATARVFASQGKNLILISRRKEALVQLKETLNTNFPNSEVIIKVVDLSEIKNCYRLFDELEHLSIDTWINNAGVGMYSHIVDQDFMRTEQLLRLNIEAVTILSMLFVKKYADVDQTQLINVSSAGGYTVVPTAITYCGTKFYVSAFTEGLAHELNETKAKMKAKVLAPAAAKTEFGAVANQVESYDYDKAFGTYHTSEELAEFLWELYQSEQIVGYVSRERHEFELSGAKFDYSGNSARNQVLQK